MDADRRESISEDIATVVLSEERAFDDDADGQRTALLLVAIAHYETGRSWASWIDSGKCNDAKWRAAHPQWIKSGDCDGGHAYGMWQVHPPNEDATIGRTYVADRKTGIRAALSIARESLKAGAGLCHYSGESQKGPHGCRLASMRLETARSWVEQFPFKDKGHVE
jgi:hypothetical protein